MYNTNLEHEQADDKLSLEELLRENIRYSRSILVDTQKIRKHMMWRTIFNIIWMILFVAPVIVALFWLPSFMGDYTKQLQGITGGDSNATDLLQQLQQLK